MKVEDVKARVEQIDRASGDDEAAHIMEDELYRDVLQEIANGSTIGHKLAKEALETKKIRFSRWCA